MDVLSTSKETATDEQMAEQEASIKDCGFWPYGAHLENHMYFVNPVGEFSHISGEEPCA